MNADPEELRKRVNLLMEKEAKETRKEEMKLNIVGLVWASVYAVVVFVAVFSFIHREQRADRIFRTG